MPSSAGEVILQFSVDPVVVFFGESEIVEQWVFVIHRKLKIRGKRGAGAQCFDERTSGSHSILYLRPPSAVERGINIGV
jgi:hypothetical protein